MPDTDVCTLNKKEADIHLETLVGSLFLDVKIGVFVSVFLPRQYWWVSFCLCKRLSLQNYISKLNGNGCIIINADAKLDFVACLSLLILTFSIAYNNIT